MKTLPCVLVTRVYLSSFANAVFRFSRLWRLLAEQALESLDLAMAEKAFVLCGKDAYHGVKLVKHLSTVSDRYFACCCLFGFRYTEKKRGYSQ